MLADGGRHMCCETAERAAPRRVRCGLHRVDVRNPVVTERICR